MATIIPPIGSTTMQAGEKRFAERLKQKLGENCICWFDVSIGDKAQHPDFIILHPNHGLLVLEVKDWQLSTIKEMNRKHCLITVQDKVISKLNPIEQARKYMHAITDRLEQDPQLISQKNTSYQGKVLFPYGHGVVFTNIDRAQFNEKKMGDVIPSHLVICKDEMLPSVEAEAFQKRLWDMFPYKFSSNLDQGHIDRIRWHMFPEIRIGAQTQLFDSTDSNDQIGLFKGLFLNLLKPLAKHPEPGKSSTSTLPQPSIGRALIPSHNNPQKTIQIPDMLQVMDMQQEQLARGLGEGHRVIHGVAGSGKTIILSYRAEHLASLYSRPILVLCYNRQLAAKLKAMMESKGLQDKVHVMTFHAWCYQQLTKNNITLPQKNGYNNNAYYAACVNKVIQSVKEKSIPTGQYDAVLIDEGHDFQAEWLSLVAQMVNPEKNSLLLLYDDAQSIYGEAEKMRFSFSSVGIQARGRTSILRVNYRNTAEILAISRAFADDLLDQKNAEEDEVPTISPVSAGLHGVLPRLIKLASMQEEVNHLIAHLQDSHKAGTPWENMAVIYRSYSIGKAVTEGLANNNIPFYWPQNNNRKKFDRNTVMVLTMHSSKGLEFPLVAIPAIGKVDKKGGTHEEEARLLYVAMTRATQKLIMTYSDESWVTKKMQKAVTVLAT